VFAIRILNFLKGYVIVNVEGFFLERFLNIAAHRRIYLWNVRHLGSAKMRLSISAKGFTQIHDIVANTQSHLSIAAKRGLPFIVYKYRRRVGIAIGLFIFFVMIFVLSRFIWVIDIEYAGDKVPTDKIYGELAAAGLKTGSFISGVGKDDVARHLMTNISEFSWVGINIKGTRGIVQIKERMDPPQMPDESKPCHIVAARAGVIETINTRLGEQCVSRGDAVSDGQLLVSGIADSAQLGVRYTHATSEIIARTWLESSSTAEDFILVRNRNGAKKSKHIISIFSWNIPLFLNENVDFAEFDRETSTHNLRLGENFILPFAFKYDKFYSVDIDKQPISADEAIANAAAKARADLTQKLISGDSKILGEEVSTTTAPTGELIVTVSWECLENIGKQEEIL
jgi:similar to stage IV sporulation protein